jgi:hypothetical protein
VGCADLTKQHSHGWSRGYQDEWRRASCIKQELALLSQTVHPA